MLSASRRTLVLGAFERWGYDEKGWGTTTRQRYSRTVKRAEGWLTEHHDRSILWANTKLLRAFLFSTAPNARNRNNVRQALAGFGEFAVTEGYWSENFALALPRLPEPESTPKALGPTKARRVEQVAKLHGGIIWALFSLLLFGGLRLDEARTLEWRTVEIDDGWMTIRGKGSKERRLPLHPTAVSALEAWRRECPDPRWVFPSPRGRLSRPIGIRWIGTTVKAVGRAADVPELHPHMLRHTAATRLLELGADVRTVQEYLGHADPKTTSIYLKVRPVRLAEAVHRLDYEEREQDDDATPPR